MSEGFNIFKFMATFDRRVIYILVFLLVLAPVLNPIGMPIAVTEDTRIYYAELQKLDEEDVVWAAWQTGFSAYNELKAGIIATYREVIRSNAKMVVAYGTTEDAAIFELVFGDADKGVRGILARELEQYDYKEGEDYVVLGYVLVNEASTSSLAANLHNVVEFDHKGRPLAGTFFDDLNNAGDFTLIIDFSPGMQTTNMIKHWVLDYGTPMIEGAIGVNVPSLLPYRDTGQLKAMLQSTRGCAELEYISGFPGQGITSMDAFTLVHFMIVLFIIMGNIGYFAWERKQTGRARTAIQ
ncbi:hypothetical protein JXL21_04355 [Candidatus Bathyarchaeota archaeon]|nr:hypothetical protein [Candidatus Bathyarchaeota archaeon]